MFTSFLILQTDSFLCLDNVLWCTGTANFDNIQLIAFSFVATLFESKEEIIGKCNVMKLSPVLSFRIF